MLSDRKAIITEGEVKILIRPDCSNTERQAIFKRLTDTFDAYEPDTITRAQDMCRDGELEVDDGAVISRGDDAGTYVMAWLWVEDDQPNLRR